MVGKFSQTDLDFMHQALLLAKKGGRTSPNPAVGAVIVKNGKMIATGYHRGPGSPHAEADALRKLKNRAPGATLYVTLEPCCHTEKRTPPCVKAVLESEIRRVVVGSLDPNPRVNGKGVRLLRSKGVKVELGCRPEECKDLIRPYEKWMEKGIPYLILKSAMTLDGKIATDRGESRWITGQAARRKVHLLRSEVDAVMVGSQTVMKDNPELTVRLVSGDNPLRVVLDSKLRLPLNRKVFSHLKQHPTILAVLRSKRDHPKVFRFQKKGVHLIFCRPNRKGRVDLADLFRELGNRGIMSLLVEGGATLASALIAEGVLDELWLFIAPRLLGGGGLDLFNDLRVTHLTKTPWLKFEDVSSVGEDLLLRLRLKN